MNGKTVRNRQDIGRIMNHMMLIARTDEDSDNISKLYAQYIHLRVTDDKEIEVNAYLGIHEKYKKLGITDRDSIEKIIGFCPQLNYKGD